MCSCAAWPENARQVSARQKKSLQHAATGTAVAARHRLETPCSRAAAAALRHVRSGKFQHGSFLLIADDHDHCSSQHGRSRHQALLAAAAGRVSDRARHRCASRKLGDYESQPGTRAQPPALRNYHLHCTTRGCARDAQAPASARHRRRCIRPAERTGGGLPLLHRTPGRFCSSASAESALVVGCHTSWSSHSDLVRSSRLQIGMQHMLSIVASQC